MGHDSLLQSVFILPLQTIFVDYHHLKITLSQKIQQYRQSIHSKIYQSTNDANESVIKLSSQMVKTNIKDLGTFNFNIFIVLNHVEMFISNEKNGDPHENIFINDVEYYLVSSFALYPMKKN